MRIPGALLVALTGVLAGCGGGQFRAQSSVGGQNVVYATIPYALPQLY